MEKLLDWFLIYTPTTFYQKRKISNDRMYLLLSWQLMILLPVIIVININCEFTFITGKMQVLDYILAMTKSTTTDKVTVHINIIFINHLISLLVNDRPMLLIMNFSWKNNYFQLFPLQRSWQDPFWLQAPFIHTYNK